MKQPHRYGIRTLLGVTLVIASLMAVESRAAASPIEVEVATEMTALPEHAAQIKLAADTEARARVQGADTSAAATIGVHVEFLQGQRIGWYAYEVTATHRGRAIEPVRGECRTCKPKELVAKIGDAVALQRAAVLRADAEPEPAALEPVAPDPKPASAEVSPTVHAADEVPRRRWTAIGKAGIGVAALGAVALTVGIVLAVRDDGFAAANGDVQQERRRNLRPAGVGLAAGGGALLVGGVTMIILDRVRAKRGGRVAFAPALGRRELALVIGGRF